jgi:DNA-binding NtrC family response regulator
MACICVIDDQAMMRDSLQATLAAHDHKVSTFGNGQEALTLIKQQSFDVVLTDLRMPGLDGIGLLREMRRLGIDVPVVLMTAHGSVPNAVEAMKLGAFDYVQKPFDGQEIEIVIERALRERNLVRDNEIMRRTIEDLDRDHELIGQSPAMRPVLEKVQRVAQSSATVLITGESGTGKELIARAIYAASPRAHQPMLCVNCAALSPTLLESELFGHEKGAFTGADRMRKGRFELADGGTLFLDEVEGLPPTVQVRLLRVLQERSFERVGGSESLKVDVRLIAATSRDLVAEVAAGRFREDLHYRLSVVRLELPPLRTRPEDIPALVEEFIREFDRLHGRRVTGFTRGVLDRLMRHAWPGNVRELRNTVEGMVMFAEGRRALDLSDLPDTLREADDAGEKLDLRVGMTVAEAERRLLEATLRHCGGDKPRAAAMLGIGLRTLYRKLQSR